MDGTGDGVPPMTDAALFRGPIIDLHVHSTASDGELSPEAVVRRAAAAGLTAMALTDHDTLAGVPAAITAGETAGIRVIGGCEFSVAAPWGEMHVLGYFLPPGTALLENFLTRCRADRERRGRAMVERLHRLGIGLSDADVLAEAEGGAVGRPHVARALVRRGDVGSVGEAFDRYLGRGRPAFVEKSLPSFMEVAELVHRVGGVVSAAHLKDRGTRSLLVHFKQMGLDAVETRHPSHDPDVRARLTEFALDLGLHRTGGSDWHGDAVGDEAQIAIGSQNVPLAWLDALEGARPPLATPVSV
jgi:3',5'-nucleoside bisphosphate phosphatase